MSGVRVSFPSLYAPAPPQPQRMPQSAHSTQGVEASAMGQLRRSISLPFSMMRTFRRGCLTSSSAAKIPAGPEPMMMTS
jgi:hypothetical protein